MVYFGKALVKTAISFWLGCTIPEERAKKCGKGFERSPEVLQVAQALHGNAPIMMNW